MRFRIRYIIIYLAFVFFVGALLVGAWGYHRLKTPFKGYSDAKFVIIERGAPTNSIAQTLVQEGVISNKWTFLMYLTFKKRRGETLKAGEYYFDAPTSQIEVADKLIKGKVYQHSVTVPEGLTMFDIAGLFAQTGLFDKESLLDEMKNPKPIKDLDSKAEDLEGYLFPDTYLFRRGTSSAEIVGRMVKRFRDVFDERYRQRSRELGLGTRDVVTLASLIEKETGRDEERPLVSAVFMNRLKKEIPLQCDPTVLYAKLRLGAPVDVIDPPRRIIDRATLNVDSPYNTYKHLGLPPGPIANPGRKSIEAALYPANVDFFYFVSKNDGTHFFSRTLSQHNDAVAKYQH